MKDFFKCTNSDVIKRVYEHPENFGLKYKEFGKSDNIKDYSVEEISKMLCGVYTDTGYLLVDGDYFINVNEVIQAGCTLEDVTTKVKLDLSKPIPINQIQTFYIKNYYLITQSITGGTNKHYISSFLFKKAKMIYLGRCRFKGLYRISNSYKCLQVFGNTYLPKDLFYPIKLAVNDVFFHDHYRIDDFIVDSKLTIIH